MDLTQLLQSHCQPLKGNEHRLRPEQIDAALSQLDGWQRVDEGAALCRTFRFPDYYRTLAFVNALAFVAHREDHHPDLGVHYDRCVVRYSTHDADGITLNDVICAARANALYAEAP